MQMGAMLVHNVELVLHSVGIHLSNDDFDIARFLHGRKSYVVFPTVLIVQNRMFHQFAWKGFRLV